MILSPLTYAHALLEDHIQPGDQVLDATVGNGHDFVFLMNQVGPDGRVIGFDIQRQALHATRERISQLDEVCDYNLYLESHALLADYVDPQSLSAVVFNLGYLPRADKSVVTKADSTLKAIEAGLEALKTGGLMTIMVYWGHEGGQEERQAVENYLEDLDQQVYTVIRYQPVNQIHTPPYLLIIEKH